jgi:hypothetical protein
MCVNNIDAECANEEELLQAGSDQTCEWKTQRCQDPADPYTLPMHDHLTAAVQYSDTPEVICNEPCVTGDTTELLGSWLLLAIHAAGVQLLCAGSNHRLHAAVIAACMCK